MDLFGLDKHDTASIAGGLSLQLILSKPLNVDSHFVGS